MGSGTTSDGAADQERLRLAFDGVAGRVAAACARVGRDPASVTIVAVSKTVAIERLRTAIDLGIGTLGENRVQEAAAKIVALPPATWHLVGPLQSNKARRAIELFDVIETVDSLDLASRLDRLSSDLRADRPVRTFVQVNVDDDPAKAGFVPAALDDALGQLLILPGLAVEGLMTIGRLVSTADDARPTFRALRALSERLRERHPRLGSQLSMGMTDDFEVAVEEGATVVRVGRAIFGERATIGTVDSPA
ncbi:MAG TPA: YggS family pyridoxal phosphate-dependent enzyme [Candidatus Limnocylindrales bacterium]|nr:YggS family pyridoxal phosphate-dependent enzyme [Candidatus Limnocylindrales bacterium]